MRRTVRWAWERDEIDPTVTEEKVVLSTVLHGSILLLSLIAGAVLWASGRVAWASTVWIVGVGLTTFFGTIAVGWDVLELLGSRRTAAEDETAAREPDRELAPGLQLSRDAKIAFVITVILLLLIAVVAFTAEALA